MIPNDPKRRWWRREISGTTECLVRPAYKTGGALQWRFPWDDDRLWKRVEDDGCWRGPVPTYDENEAKIAKIKVESDRLRAAVKQIFELSIWMDDSAEADVRAIVETVSDLMLEPEDS